MKSPLKTTLLGLLGAATLGVGMVAPPPAFGQGRPGRPALELSEGQRAEMGRILAQGQADIAALLTPTQQAAFTAALEGNTPYAVPRALRGLDLSAEQRTQVRTVMGATWAQLAQVLTPEQRQQWQAQWQGQGGEGRQGWGQRGQGWGARIAALNLTPEQQSQIEAILAARQEAIAANLTPAQRSAFQDSWQTNQNLWQALRAANLTQPQRQALRQEMQGLQRDIAAILTEEQRQQLRPQGRPGQRPQP